jgi:hypothetical protein
MRQLLRVAHELIAVREEAVDDAEIIEGDVFLGQWSEISWARS